MDARRYSDVAPSLLAAAILLAARRTIGLNPAWRPELEQLTRRSKDEIRDAASSIYDLFRSEFPAPERAAGEAMQT